MSSSPEHIEQHESTVVDGQVESHSVVASAARVRASVDKPLRAPGILIRPTASDEQRRLDSRPGSGQKDEARRFWAVMPDVDHEGALNAIVFSRPASALSHQAALKHEATDTASSSRAGSATLMRPNSGGSVTRTLAQSIANASSATAVSLLASKTQQRLSGDIHLDSPPQSSLHRTDTKDAGDADEPSFLGGFRPQSVSYARSLRDRLRASSSRYRVQPSPITSPTSNVTRRRKLTTAPSSLLQEFENRVRASSPYVPVDVEKAQEHVFQATHSSPVREDQRASAAQYLVATRPLASTHLPSKRPFHERGEYTADVVDLYATKEYYSFERQRVLDIHEKGERLREDVAHAQYEKWLMAQLRSQTVRQEAAFWKAHKIPTKVDLQKMMPGMGSNTQQVDVIVSTMVEQGTKAVELGGSPKWSLTEKKRFYDFIGKRMPTAAAAADSNKQGKALSHKSATGTGRPPRH